MQSSVSRDTPPVKKDCLIGLGEGRRGEGRDTGRRGCEPKARDGAGGSGAWGRDGGDWGRDVGETQREMDKEGKGGEGGKLGKRGEEIMHLMYYVSDRCDVVKCLVSQLESHGRAGSHAHAQKGKSSSCVEIHMQT